MGFQKQTPRRLMTDSLQRLAGGKPVAFMRTNARVQLTHILPFSGARRAQMTLQQLSLERASSLVCIVGSMPRCSRTAVIVVRHPGVFSTLFLLSELIKVAESYL